MPLLTAAVVVLTVLVLVDLALTLAVVRHLRAGARPTATPVPELVGTRVGSPTPHFTASGEDGVELVAADLAGTPTLLAFFSTTCEACVEHAPALVAEVPRLAAAGIVVVPVLVGDGDPLELAPALRHAGPLVREEHGGEVSTAFGVRGTPSYVLLGADTRVAAAGLVLQDVVSSAATVR
ncbi:TlpA disulfide reductase family protein [Cellulosimicrobium arenosum]|uniref:TlpA family protein disulfide reductase n=1 Tax=Cellulosimicrobium arenosum TaxID=2708133 RepID=A0A927G8W4_9MICO|nr:TlpA disulfide reductase family protein [Cellulosimicrobium arenosum]MBD8078582.1 TlpA family protein disulfide reductase [Cellulosimicrobium arenosum]